MTIAFMDHLLQRVRTQTVPALPTRMARRLRMSTTTGMLFFLSALLLCASMTAYSLQSSLLAGHKDSDACNWYTVGTGDTLTNIASSYHTTVSLLASANAIRDTNLIFVDQRLCIPARARHAGSRGASSGMERNGTVNWYNYNALGWSSRSQVRHMLYSVAAMHHLPPRLLLAIAWQESGWTQHVIAWDGGIGVMQLMPYTAMSLNASMGQQLNPYALWDNLNLGATYLQWLWRDFGGNLPQVISAYNEGGWAVCHVGIYNWSYVNNVMALMHNLG